MTTRIRYSRNGELRTSTQEVLLPNGQVITINLNPVTNSYSFITPAGSVVSTGTSNSFINLKKLVKSTLINLGVTFNPEVRNRKSKTLTGAA